MRKFLDVDILASLQAIVQRNTLSWQSDFFEHDIAKIRACAQSGFDNDKFLLWMSRPAGTWCFTERDVFLQDTFENYTWGYYGGHDGIMAFAIEIGTSEGGGVQGHLYQLNYSLHINHVRASAVPAEIVSLEFADGYSEKLPFAGYGEKTFALAKRHGEIQRRMYEPANEKEFQSLLIREHRTRAAFPPRTMDWFIKALNRDPAPHSLRASLEQAKQEVKDAPAAPNEKKGRDMCK